MKYCVNFKKNFKYIDEVDELTINFRKEDKSLIDFLLLHKDKRINIKINDIEDFIKSGCIHLFDAIVKEYPEIDFSLKLPEFKKEEKIEMRDFIDFLKERQIKFFLEDFVKDWDVLYGIMELGPSDIYIVENLGFEIIPIAEILHSKGIKIRAFPNVAQSSWNTSPGFKKFFIRPEDVDTYEPYVDVMEFFGNSESIETYYKIYAKDKKWFGKLNEVIIGLNEDIDSRCIIPIFAEKRLNCGKRCLKGRHCNICDKIKKLADVFEQEKLILKY